MLSACLLSLPALAFQQVDAGAKPFDDLLLRYAGSGWSGSVLVQKDGRVLLADGYGFADFQSDRANEAGTLFEIASITKSFTAVAVVKLAQQGKLALDDSIAVRLPGVPQHSRAITLRQLLAHTSGIPRTQADGRGEDLELAVAAYLGAGPKSKPGAKHEYWNGGYALLAGVIERASGRSYTGYLEQELFAPAGMGDTGFTGDMDLDAGRAALGSARDGRDRGALEHPYGSYGYEYRGMGGIVMSVLDFAKWDRALAGNAILDQAHTRALFEPVKDGYALGWTIGRAQNGALRQSHGGAVRGFTAEFRRYPAENACIAVLCNSDEGRPREISENLECLLFGRSITTPPPKGELMSREQAEAIAGNYSGTAGRLVVRAAPGVLMAGLEGEALLAKAVAPEKLDWRADLALLRQRAVEIVEGIAQGDVEPLRTHMAKRIMAGWPDTVQRSIWPAHLDRHGAFKRVHALGVLARGGRVQVLLALEHERVPAHVLVAFSSAGLELLDWRGPRFLASARLEPLSEKAFRLLLGNEPQKLEFELAGGKPISVRLGGLKLMRQ